MHASCRLSHPRSYRPLDSIMFAYLCNKTKINLHALKSCMEICPFKSGFVSRISFIRLERRSPKHKKRRSRGTGAFRSLFAARVRQSGKQLGIFHHRRVANRADRIFIERKVIPHPAGALLRTACPDARFFFLDGFHRFL